MDTAEDDQFAFDFRYCFVMPCRVHDGTGSLR